MSFLEIKQAAAALPEQEKSELVAYLLRDLPPASAEDASEDSLAEARRREKQLESGEAKLLSSEEFWASIKSA